MGVLLAPYFLRICFCDFRFSIRYQEKIVLYGMTLHLEPIQYIENPSVRNRKRKNVGTEIHHPVGAHQIIRSRPRRQKDKRDGTFSRQ